jgi:hypothetical protein
MAMGSWGAFGDWSECAGAGECAPGERRDSEDCDRCAEEVCSDTCQWAGDCELASTSECFWDDGTNWRCCGSSSWQFCLPTTCQWSSDCEVCSGCGC